MRVYLTGFMASGKSALGRALAGEIGFGFVDLDALIEQAAGKSVREIFMQDGEPAFREAEAAALRTTTSYERYVIAVGGGALVSDESMTWALEHGLVVFLDLSVEEIVRRLVRSRTRRPLIDAMRSRPGELEANVSTLLEERRPSYERAHVTFRPARTTVQRNARSLARSLESLLRPEGRDPRD